MKHFLKALKEKMTAYEVFLILISAIVGTVFSLLGGLDIMISIYICIGIIAFFLIATIIIQFLVDRFNVLHLIKKFNKNKQYNLAIALGSNLSIGLWHTYNLKLRVKVGEQLKEAAQKSLITANDKQYEMKYILSNILIDDLGYTNYILNNVETAYENICAGIKIIDQVLCKSNKADINEQKFKELKLKALRHEMGMLADIEKLPNGEETVHGIKKNFNELFEDLSDASEKNSDALLCAEYANIKDAFHAAKTNSNNDEAEDALKRISDLKNEINNIIDKVRCSEWQFKCDRLKWEIQLFLEKDIYNNYRELLGKIEEPEDKTINRYIDIYKRFLQYSYYLIIHTDISSPNATLHLKTYKTELKQARKIASDFLFGCEAKKQMEEINCLNKNLDTALKEAANNIKKRKAKCTN